VNPNLSWEELRASVYQVNSFHADGISKEVFEVLGNVAKSYWSDHRPAATAVEVKSLNGGVRLEITVLPSVDV
jgi:enamine deaminase RidA (YjgF/YER057c/UK114 family)